MKKAVVVSILNQKLTVKSDSDEDYVKEVAGFVDRKIQETMKQSRPGSTLTAALLACMNIADELMQSRKVLVMKTSAAAGKIRDLLGQIAL